MDLSFFFYNTGIRFYKAAIRLSATLGKNKKAQQWLDGRRNVWAGLETAVAGKGPVIWVHAASLGEFEQGRPVLEALRKAYPAHLILLTFFSPSGYEVRKDYRGADHVCYLPLDTPANAARFIETVRPRLAIFIKYEFWLHYLAALHDKKVPVLLISGIFRHNQVFFKWYGGLFRRLLQQMDHLFVQNEASLTLIHNIGIQHVTMSGDTRFDRVWALREHPVALPVIERFITESNVLVAGSTWPADEQLLADWWYNGGREGRQLILAPHEIDGPHLKDVAKLFPDAVFYSDFAAAESVGGNVMVIDNVGMLSVLYRYSSISYVGGGFGKEGIHNILEPATYGKPVLIGPVYHQFNEAEMLVQLRGAIVVRDVASLHQSITALNDEYYYQQVKEITVRFVEEHQGATEKIMRYIQEKRFLTKE